jgi:hypothetical protein
MEFLAKLRELFEKHQFIGCVWDGEELTCYTESGEPMEITEFLIASPTRILWKDIEGILYEYAPTSFMKGAVDVGLHVKR